MRIWKLKFNLVILPRILFLIAFLSAAINSTAQKTSTPTHKVSAPSVAASQRSPEIVRIVREIDARNIEGTIRKLVSFGTRNTLSEQNDPNRGIGAARDWLFAEFQKAAAQSDGRMTVEKQTFEHRRPPAFPNPQC